MTTHSNPLGKQTLWQMLRHNPVTIKELRSRMRGKRAFVVLTIYVLLMSLFISLVYVVYAVQANSAYGPDSRQAGKFVFAAVLGVEVVLAVFISPSFTAGAITGEKERQTYDLLRTTLLPANWFVMGKLISSLSYVLLLMLASVPLQSIAFLLGGLSVEELLISQVLVVLTAVTFAMFGLWCSATMRSTLAASVLAYVGAFFFTVGLPLIAILTTIFLGSIFFSTGSTGWVLEMFLTIGGLILAATNLPAALVVSEIILLEENTLFFFKQTFDTHVIWLFSPWIGTILIYALLGLLFYLLTVRRVRQLADK